MPETLNNPNCVLDPDSDCPLSCGNRTYLVRYLEIQAKNLSTTPATFATEARTAFNNLSPVDKFWHFSGALGGLKDSNQIMLKTCKIMQEL